MPLFTVAPPSDGGATVNRSIIKQSPFSESQKGFGGGMNQVFIMGNRTLYIYIAWRVVKIEMGLINPLEQVQYRYRNFRVPKM